MKKAKIIKVENHIYPASNMKGYRIENVALFDNGTQRKVTLSEASVIGKKVKSETLYH
jgi:hypothetical protein